MINWGIIGCGDVTEVKSGPAFNKVPESRLVAVMRRDAAKAEDYAKRHGVAKWYANANDLIHDTEINAIYIATPPLQHEEYLLSALQAGKYIYVEKPMTVDAVAGERMLNAIQPQHKVSVAHYRRAQPKFLKVKELIDSNAIGEIRFVNLQYYQKQLSNEDLNKPGVQWRLQPTVSGGGLFHDLAPHQIDLMIYFFGNATKAEGISLNQGKLYQADDLVSGLVQFENGIVFNGLWSFSVPENETKDLCTIVGSKGSISFSIFGEQEIFLSNDGTTERIAFDKLEHVQQPLIEKVVQYFLGNITNPSPVNEAVEGLRIMDAFTERKYDHY